MNKIQCLTVGQMAKRFKLSRTTLLYYGEIGLLTASQRSPANYRLYSAKDIKRMERIAFYKSTGITLTEIKNLLTLQENDIISCFETRLEKINEELQQLKQQQNILIDLLKEKLIQGSTSKITKEKWTKMLGNIGLDEAGMHEWHRQYERQLPHEHQKFLQSLHINEDEINSIRQWSRLS